jgi:hypothetical protein
MKITPTLGGVYSGSFGGITAARNRGGQYLRRRAVPTNPNTLRQAGNRSSFASCVVAWTEFLTEEQRVEWETWALNTPFIDSLGQTYHLTGQQAFIRAMMPRLVAGLTITASTPTVFNNGPPPTALLNFDATADPTEFDVAFAFETETTVAGSTLIFLGRPQNPTVNFFKGPYQYAGRLTYNSGATGSSQVDFVPEVDWTLVAGQRIPIKAYNADAGLRISYALRVMAEVGAAGP